jgi:hypothetical protein
LISALGLALMAAGGLTTAEFRYRIAPSRFLVQPMNVVATLDESHVIVGSMFAKLNVFDRNGRVQHAWQLPTDGGAFRIALAADDRVQVATEKTGRLLEYDLTGTLLEEREDAAAYARIGDAHELGFTASSGNQYLIDGGRILRSGPDADEVLVNGFADHAAITLRMILMGAGLFLGVILLIGGFVSTGRRGSAA